MCVHNPAGLVVHTFASTAARYSENMLECLVSDFKLFSHPVKNMSKHVKCFRYLAVLVCFAMFTTVSSRGTTNIMEGSLQKSFDVDNLMDSPSLGRLTADDVSCYRNEIYQGDIIHDIWSYNFNTTPEQIDNTTNALQSSSLLGMQVQYRSKKVQKLVINREHEKQKKVLQRQKRGAMTLKQRLWPGGIIPYQIDTEFDNDFKDVILQAMRHWEKYTCIRFVPRTNHSSYAYFVNGIGCCSSVGRIRYRQKVILGPRCTEFGTVLHEIGHLVGFWHEQSRPDRNDYVVIYPENIVEGEKFNFALWGKSVINSLNQPYDYDSIMHYGNKDFSKNNKYTIWGKQHHKFGQRNGLSVGDILQTNLLYRCNRTTGCGGSIFASNGVIISPSYPEPYTASMMCDWSVAVDEGSAVRFEFSDIKLPLSRGFDCDQTYVEIRDGLGIEAPLIGRYCGYMTPRPLIIDSGHFWLRFRSGSQVDLRMKGFSLRFQSVSPPQQLTDFKGSIRSLNYPLPFPKDGDYVWQIKVAGGFFVVLNIIDLKIPYSSPTGCHGDYLAIIDGETSHSKLITRLCVSESNKGVISTGGELRIELHTSAANQEEKALSPHRQNQFYGKYYSRDIDECQRNNGGCAHACWNLHGTFGCGCRPGYNFSHFFNCTDVNECANNNGGCSHECVNTEGAYHCVCLVGYLLSPNNRSLCEDVDECADPQKNRCEHQCRNTIGSFHCYCNMGYRLEADEEHCESRVNCSGVLTDYVGPIISPVISNSIQIPIDCVWRIQVDFDLTISLRFKYSLWADNDGCKDYINITERKGTNVKRSYHLCSLSRKFHDFHSKTNNLEVSFHSHWPHDKHFKFVYSTREKAKGNVQCGGTLNATGIIQTPGYSGPYPRNAECIWILLGSILNLRFEKFNLEKEERCSYDFLDIRDGDDVFENHIGRYCGSQTPPSQIVSSTGRFILEFKSDSSIHREGFRAFYYLS